MKVVKITVTDIGGTYRDVADAARTTIGLKEGKKEISESYMYKMWKKKGVEIMKIKLKGPIDNYCQRCLEVRNMELPNCERECEYYRRGLQVNPIIYEEVKRNENR